MEKISESLLNELRKNILGKRVRIRDKGAGICNYLGYNDMLPSWGLQITIDRTPVSNILLSDIEIMNNG